MHKQLPSASELSHLVIDENQGMSSCVKWVRLNPISDSLLSSFSSSPCFAIDCKSHLTGVSSSATVCLHEECRPSACASFWRLLRAAPVGES